MKMSSHLKAELAVICSTLGRLHKGEYLIEPECMESVKDLIRFLKRDNEAHEIRRHLGETKVLQNDLVHIIKSCPDEKSDLFEATLRLLVNLTTPGMLFYGEEVPEEKITRSIYLSLVGYLQDYKTAFCDVEFWNKICGKLTDLFETDWAERSVDSGIQIERILMLLRNVLQVPADLESEKRPDNDITVHDKVLWALRQSQILELLLFVSSNTNEEQYYLNLLEIFSLILREHNPKLLAQCDSQRSTAEKNKDVEELIKVRGSEKVTRNKYVNLRNFNTTFVIKGVKSLSNHDVVCHKSLDKVKEFDLNRTNVMKATTRKNREAIEIERTERRSTFSVRLFLKEFCLEFLNSSFRHFMNVVKNKLDSGKSLANDQTYYFWALKFFLDFATASDSDVDLIKNCLSSETFHFIQTNMDNAFDHLNSEKKKTVDWVKRIHLILKAYRSLLETLLWMDSSKSPITRSLSREIKSQIFYVVEYREMTLNLLLKYDSKIFSASYLRDLIETTHLFIKLLEEYSKQTKLVVQKITRKKSSNKKGKKANKNVETPEEKWEKIKDDVYDILCSESSFPEIPPFDAALDIPIDDQKGRAMKNIQKYLREGKIKDGIGLLRSARQVWPENDYFGTDRMSVEDEVMALQEICLADLGEVEGEDNEKDEPLAGDFNEEEDKNEEFDEESQTQITEQDFDIMDYKMRLVNKKVVEGCGILLKNYKQNPDHTNHCVIKLLHRIGWECSMPAMLFQASLFWTLLKIMRDKTRNYQEINTFTENLVRKFRKLAEKNCVVFLELLFWKERKTALEIQCGYDETIEKKTKKKKSKGNSSGENRRRKKKDEIFLGADELEINESSLERRTRKRTQMEKNIERSEFESGTGDEDGRENLAASIARELFSSDSYSDDNETNTTKRSRRGATEGNEKEDCQPSSLNIRTVDEPAETSAKSNKENNDSIHLKSSKRQGRKTKTKSNSRRAFLESSDEEKEEEATNNRLENVQHGDEERTKLGKTFPEEKDIDETSNRSSKKRSLGDKKKRVKGPFMDDDDNDNDIDISKSKRIRYIGSDSDVENFETEKEEPIFSKKKMRRRLAVIDSDSEVEGTPLDEK